MTSFIYVYFQDVRGDVGGAQEAGMMGILVKTGKIVSGQRVILEINNFLHKSLNSALLMVALLIV